MVLTIRCFHKDLIMLRGLGVLRGLAAMLILKPEKISLVSC